LASSLITLSAYVKNVDAQYVGLAISTTASGNYATVEFDLASTGTVNRTAVSGTGFSVVSSSITPVGSGWFRCAAVVAVGTAAVVDPRTSIYMSDGTASFDGRGRAIYTGTSRTLQLWGAQLSDSASLDPYVYNPGAAPASTAYFGPRFDYDPVTLAPKGLLIEEQRTNSIRNSVGVGAVAGTPGTMPTNWSATGSTNGITREILGAGVEGGVSYIDIRYSGTPTSGSQYLDVTLDNSVAGTPGQVWSVSAYLRRLAGSFTNMNARLMIYETPSFASGGFALTDLTVTNDPLVQQRRSHAHTNINGTTTGVSARVAFTFPAGVASEITLRIGLPQLELGAFATSVIPTTTAAATRAADVAVMTGANFSNWYNQSEGTIYFQGDSVRPIASSPVTRCFQIDDGTVNENIRSGSTSSLQVVDGGVVQANLQPSPTIPFDGTVFNFASAYKLNDFASSTGGVALTDTSGTLPTVTQMVIGSTGSGAFLSGHIRRIAYFPRRLSDAELTSITS